MNAVYLILLFIQICNILGVSREEYNCAVCLAVVEEVKFDINDIDPKKLIEVGSYRIDPNGNQMLKQVPYAKSETHLYEVLENICGEMTKYGNVEEQKRGIYIRHTDHVNKKLSGVSVQEKKDMGIKLKSACETFLEDHFDDVVENFRSSGDDYLEKICIDASDACTSENVTDVEDIKAKITYIQQQPPPQDVNLDQDMTEGEFKSDEDTDDKEEEEEDDDGVKEGDDDDDKEADHEDKEEL